jgi:hypothetical protein
LGNRAVDLRVALSESNRFTIADEIASLNEEIKAARWGLYELTANAIGTDYIAADVAGWCERAVAMGAGHPRIDRADLWDLLHVRKVPNAPFRAALRGDVTGAMVAEVHRRLSKIERERGVSCGASGLLSSNGPQTRLVRRWLGMETNPGRGSYLPTLRIFIGYEQAEVLAHVLNLAPHQAGI